MNTVRTVKDESDMLVAEVLEIKEEKLFSSSISRIKFID
jgi:hypothetical protein